MGKEYLELSEEAKDFIESVLQLDPEERIDLEQMLMHPFILSGVY